MLRHLHPLSGAVRRAAWTGALVVSSALAAGDGAVPWPGGVRPTASEIDAALAEAEALRARDRAEAFLEAAERGEDAEHVRVFQEEIDRGVWDLPGLFALGDALFEHVFRAEEGLGDSAAPQLRRVHTRLRGGLDTFSCAGCHSVGGADGGGTAAENAFVEGDGRTLGSADVRNAPHVLGLGFVQALGVEMTDALRATRDAAVAEAEQRGEPVEVELVAKGVAFGRLVASPDGTIDGGQIEGVDDDLVVRPFGWKGDVARLRRFVEEAARVHFGVQAHTLALAARDRPDDARLGTGPWYDPDGDGVQRELEEGTLTAASVYLAMLPTPQILAPADAGLRDRWARGSVAFDALGCAACHVRQLDLRTGAWTERPDTTDGAGVSLNLVLDGEAPRGTLSVALFSDLRRHDMGERLADAHESASGVARGVFLTRPLWGVADTGPWLHDGRAATLHDAIEAHGGEADEARDAYLALDDDGRRDVEIFLLSLTRSPRLRVAR